MTCPICGKETWQAKLGSWWNERWVRKCRCGYNSDTYNPDSPAAIQVTKTTLRQAGINLDKKTLREQAEEREQRRQDKLDAGIP